MSKSFGRDEMNALIGGNGDGTEEMAAFRRSSQPPSSGAGGGSASSASRGTKPREVDISKLTAAETAKLLSDQQQRAVGGANNAITRVYRSRTKKVMAHHQLLEEELQKQQQQQQQQQHEQQLHQRQQQQQQQPQQDRQRSHSDSDSNSDSDRDEFVRDRDRQRDRRPTRAAVVVSRRSGGSEDRRRRRRRRSDSSSDSSSSDESSARRRGRRQNQRERRNRRDQSGGSSSSSDNDEEEDNRRRNRRVLASQRATDEPETILVTKAKREPAMRKESDPSPTPQPIQKETLLPESAPSRTPRRGTKPRRRASSSSSSSGSDSDGSSASSSSSSGSSSESEDDEPVRLKPVFVPKHKRNLVVSEADKLREEELTRQREIERTQKRKAESRALVAKELAAAASAESALRDYDDEADDETKGATNAYPSDDDYDDNDDDNDNGDREEKRRAERNAWELRELERLLRSMDRDAQRQREAEEYARRRQLTDAECLAEDRASGRYQAPGANRASSTAGRAPKRFFHRGAYYMDDSEWDEGDVRHKSTEYAMAHTGDDPPIDASKLPEVMRVKNFGRARQNTRYKGLAKEDTTDRSARVLPLRPRSGPPPR